MSSVSNEIPASVQEISKKTLALRLQIKALENTLDEEEAKLYETMKSLNIEKFTTEFGGYTSAVKPTWKYSKNIDVLKEQLDVAKKTEENQGIAVKTVVTSYKYVPMKISL